MHRVNLDLTCTEKFNQDTYRQIISIGKDNTGKCTKGCEIYIEITNQQRTKYENVNYLSEFTISYHSSLDIKIMSLPINEDINGATSLRNNSTFLSNTLINVDTSIIFIAYNSLLYKGYLVIDRNVTPSSSEYDQRLSWDNSYKIAKTTFNNKLLQFAFESPYKADEQNYYQLKIMPQYKNTPTLLYVTNGKSHITYYDNYNFIIPIYEYENQNTVVISVVSSYYDEKSPQDYEMYVNVIEASIIDKIPYSSEEMNNYLPDLNNHQIEGKGCIILNKEKLIHNNDYYILVHVLGSGFFELLVSANINANNLFIPFVTNPTFFYIPPSEKINSMFYIYGEKKLNFTIIKGNGKYDYLPEKLTNISIESTSSEEGFGYMSMKS